MDQTKNTKIYERNPDTDVIRWRYVGDYGNEKVLTDDEVGNLQNTLRPRLSETVD